MGFGDEDAPSRRWRDWPLSAQTPAGCINATMTGDAYNSHPMRIRLVVAATLAMSASLSAQWLKYPTPGVPRTADGKPNLSAPAPRLADGRPDLSGVWQLETNASAAADYPAAPEFLNLGAKLPGATLPYQPWAETLVK